MNEMVEWLKAQIDADEALARESLKLRTEGDWLPGHEPGPDSDLWVWDDWGPTSAPALGVGIERVLAECTAKRAMIEFHEHTQQEYFAAFEGRGTHVVVVTEPPTVQLVHALARVYADRPGFRDQWRA